MNENGALTLVMRIYVTQKLGVDPVIRHRNPTEEEREKIRNDKLTVIGFDSDEVAYYFDPDAEPDEENGMWEEIAAYHD